MVDRPHHPAGREKLRASGFAPPRRAKHGPTLVKLQSNAHRCPYCGSTETRLENIFGPTPCRSLRYCATCRQPFEQFKTMYELIWRQSLGSLEDAVESGSAWEAAALPSRLTA